jgi:hypothetical protein
VAIDARRVHNHEKRRNTTIGYLERDAAGEELDGVDHDVERGRRVELVAELDVEEEAVWGLGPLEG